MAPYATADDLETFLGSPVPDDADRLLARATELITYVAVGVIDPEDATTLELLRDAVCAQVEQWINVGEDNSIAGRTKDSKTTIGSFSMESNAHYVAPRALQILSRGNLILPIRC